MKGLTRRQQEVLDYIADFRQRRGYAPSVRDIAAHLGLVSAAGVHKHIKALVSKGFLGKEALRSRTLRVLRTADGERAPAPAADPGFVELPLAGYVAAGRPIEAVAQQGETIAVPRDALRRVQGNYVLQVRGDSMIEEAILDGDYVVMEPRETARNGETVVALINGDEATLKRFYRENGQIRLQPANAQMAPLIFTDTDVRVQGVVVAIWRRYR